MRIDYYYSLMSPYAYLGGSRLETLANQRGVDVTYRPLDIMGLFERTGGLPVGKRHPARQAYRLQDLRRRAARAGLPLNLKPAHFPVDTRPASIAILAAQAAGAGVGLASHALLRAVWAEEKDITDPAVIERALTSQGIDPGALAPHLATAEAAYERSADEAAAAGVFGSPTYVIGDEIFWGSDQLDALDEFLSEDR